MQNNLSGVGSQSLQFREWAHYPATSGTTGNQTDQMRISFFSTKLDSFVYIDDINGLLLPGTLFHDFSDTGFSEGIWWLNILNPTDEEIDILSKVFSIHQLTIEDIKTREAIEKVETFKQYYFCSIRSFYKDEDKDGGSNLEPTNLYAIVFGGGILSFAFGQSEHAANVRKRVGRLGTGAPLSGNWICYALIDDIVDSFGPVILHIEQETSTIEDSTFITPADDSGPLLRQIYRSRMKIMAALGLLRNKVSVIKSFARQCDEQNTTVSHGEIHLYFGDIQDHVATMMSDLDHFENMLSRSHWNYLARLSTDGIKTRNRTVTVLSRMAVIGGIAMALNVVCGLFGMNVPVPGGDADGLYWWFGILSVIIIIIFVSLIVTRVIQVTSRPGRLSSVSGIAPPTPRTTLGAQ